MAKQISERAVSGAVAPLRGVAAGNPALSRLLDEVERYVQVKGERVIRSAGTKALKAIETGGVGGALGALARGATRGAGAAKSTLIIHDIDIARPVSTVYNQWTQYDAFGEFMHTVEGVEKRDEVQSNWRLKVGPSRRTWRARVTEASPDRRIAWTSEGAKGTTRGVVTFHPLADDLTRVGVVLQYFPQGPVEKVANVFRVVSRRTRRDLRNFRRYVTEREESTGAWRGEVRDGQIVEEHADEAQ